MIVENAKQHIATAVKMDTQPPYTDVNPLIVSSAPAASPYPIGTPLQRITRAVNVQITIVSTNTSKMPKNPCFTGFLVSAQACAIDPVPSPASLEKIPRDTPFFILIKKLPTAPPVTDAGRNAPARIAPKTCGTFFIFSKTTPSASTMYITAINGTSFSVTCPIRLMPPSRISAISPASTIPMIRFNIGAASSEMIL